MRNRIITTILYPAIVIGCAAPLAAQWYRIPDIKYTNVYCMTTVGDSTIFVGGDNATLLRSTDNGATWTNVMGSTMYVDTVLSLAYAGGYVFAGANGVESVYRSSDYGTTWSVANTGLPPNAIMNAFAVSGDTIFAATDQGVYVSDDSGATWKAEMSGLSFTPPSPGQGGGMVGIATARRNVYTISMLSGGVYESLTDSIFWTQIAPDTFNMGYAMAAIDTNIFIGTLKGVYLYRRGAWTPRNNGLPSDTTAVYSCLFATVDTLLFADFGLRDGPLYVTSDLGETWAEVGDSAFGGAAVTNIAVNSSYLFAGTNAGAWRIPISDVITSVNERTPTQPEEFSLYQNYPNPFNPTTAISYQLSTVSRVTLKVYDVLGREVATLVDGVRLPGKYTVDFDGSGLASGVYFYKLTAGQYARTLKLMLLK